MLFSTIFLPNKLTKTPKTYDIVPRCGEIASWHFAVPPAPPTTEAVAGCERLGQVGGESHQGQSHTRPRVPSQGVCSTAAKTASCSASLNHYPVVYLGIYHVLTLKISLLAESITTAFLTQLFTQFRRHAVRQQPSLADFARNDQRRLGQKLGDGQVK